MNCTPWDLDLSCCDLPDEADADLIERWQAISSQLLWTASGRRWGLCEVTVRPCLRRCDGGYGFGSPFWPYKDAEGGWHNLASCGCIGDCSCTELCEVVLDGPVDSVVEVVVGTDVIDATDYRVDLVGSEYRLLRTSGACWPSCSDIKADCGTEGAFCVTYMKGIALDELAIAAVSEATCELAKACIPGCKTCRLPKNVQAVVRRGVAIQFDTAITWLRTLPAVAAFLDSVNPAGLTSPSTVWSPDVPRTRTTVVAEGS